MLDCVRGATARCSVTIKDLDGNLVDPSTSLTITIFDAVGAIVIDNQSMTKDSTGEYHYDYTVPIASNCGLYLVEFAATDGSIVSVEKDKFWVSA